MGKERRCGEDDDDGDEQNQCLTKLNKKETNENSK